MTDAGSSKVALLARGISLSRSVVVFLASAGGLASLSASPVLLVISILIFGPLFNPPKDGLISAHDAPGQHKLSCRLWRLPWKGLGDGDDTFAVNLVTFEPFQEVQVFRSDKKPLEIVWRDASNLEISVPNLAFVGDLPSEAFGVTVHVRFVPDDPEARRKHFEARGR